MLVAVSYPTESPATFPRGVKRSRTPDHNENVPVHGGHDDGMRLSLLSISCPYFPETVIVIFIFIFFIYFLYIFLGFILHICAFHHLIVAVVVFFRSFEAGLGLGVDVLHRTRVARSD